MEWLSVQGIRHLFQTQKTKMQWYEHEEGVKNVLNLNWRDEVKI